jgi:RNA polymerase sigma-70 factor (ECF subfamily)
MPRLTTGARLSTDASAQEVVQEAWLAMIRGLDKFEGRSSLRMWLLGILGNIGRSRGVGEARTVPWLSLGPADDAVPAVDPDRFRVRMTGGRDTGLRSASHEPGRVHRRRRSSGN